MQRKHWYHGVKVLLALVVVLLLALACALAWIYAAPRALPSLTPRLEAALSSPQDGFRAKIGQTKLQWEGLDHPLEIRLNHLVLTDLNGAPLATLPDLSVGLDMLQLALGVVKARRIVLHKPEIEVERGEKGALRFGTPQSEHIKANAQEDAGLLIRGFMAGKNTGPLGDLRELRIEDAHVSMRQAGDIILEGKAFNAQLKRGIKGKMHAGLQMLAEYSDAQTPVMLSLTKKAGVTDWEGKLEFSGLKALALGEIFGQPPPKNFVTGLASGTVTATVDDMFTPQKMQFDVSVEEGVIHTQELEADLPYESLKFAGMYETEKSLVLENVALQLKNKTTLQAKGVITAPFSEPGVVLDASFNQLPAADIHTVWPISQSPLSRDWVIENVRKGIASKGELHVNIPQGVAQENWGENAIAARIAYENVEVHFLPQHAPIIIASGESVFTTRSLHSHVQNGRYLSDTTVPQAEVRIDDLNVDNPYINIAMEMDANAKDVVEFMRLPPVKKSAELNLAPERVSGRLAGKADIGFYFFTPKDKSGDPIIDYAISAQAQNINVKAFRKKYDVEAANGEIALNDKQLTYKGDARVNGLQTTADLIYYYTQQNGVELQTHVNASGQADMLKRFGVQSLPISGPVVIEGKLSTGSGGEKFQGKADITQATLELPSIWLEKPAGVKAELALQVENTQAGLEFPAFSLQSPLMQASGSLTFSPAMELMAADLQKIQYNDTKLDSLEYEKIEGGHRLHAKGEALDMRPVLEADDTPFTFTGMPALQVDLEVGRLILGEGRELRSIKAVADCTKTRCEKVAAKAAFTNGAPLELHIDKKDADRMLSLQTLDGGELLRVLDITDSVKEGTLKIEGTFDAARPRKLAGELTLKDFRVQNAPILTRILSLASFTGFFDMLRGSGISFASAVVPFTLEADTITIAQAKAHGAALGLNGSGTVNFPGGLLAIEGTVVPSYTLNTMVDKIPFIGELITGGKGEGLIAAKVSLKGKPGDPDVSVNPLSILTPGFLRGIFDIFDKVPEKELTQGAP